MRSHEVAAAPFAMRLQAGDAASADEWNRAWREHLVRFCARYLRRREDAEDAASEVILRVLAARDAPDEVRPWVLRIARNLCLNRLRDAPSRAEESLGTDVDVVAPATGPLTHAARADDCAQLERILALLSPAERELLRLRYVDELRRDEIATILDLPVSVVKSRLYESIERLRASVAGRSSLSH